MHASRPVLKDADVSGHWARETSKQTTRWRYKGTTTFRLRRLQDEEGVIKMRATGSVQINKSIIGA